MSKKTFTMKNKKASKVYKCDGQLLRKIITDKGFMPTELSRMMDYCSDYLNSCTRKNKISDVCVKKLMGYRIFPQMYGVEGEIKVDEPKEVKIDKDEPVPVKSKTLLAEEEADYIKADQKAIKELFDAPSMRDLATSQVADELKAETDKEIIDNFNKRMDWLNRNAIYGIPKPDKEIEFGTPYGIVRSEKDLRDYIKQATDPRGLLWGSNLVKVRDILEKARTIGLTYNLEDMRNDLLVYATKVTNPENWVRFVECLNLVNEGSPFDPTAQEIKKVLNEKYGKLEKGVDYGYSPAPKNTSYCSYYAAGHDIAKGVFKLMQATIDDLKHDPEFKELIKQAVKEAYEEL